MCLILKNCMIDVQLTENNNISKEKIEQFIWDVSSRIGALLVSVPLVIQFPMCSKDIEMCIDSMEKERQENNIMAKRMKELLVSRNSNTSGFSGIGLYEKANSSIHIWPDKSFMTFDISNTIEFNNKEVFEVLYNHFEVDKVSGLSVSRYNKQPQIIEIVNNF